MHPGDRSYPIPLAGRLFYRLCLWVLGYHDKNASGASRDYGTVYQASTRPRAGVDTFVQPPSQNRAPESGLLYKSSIVIFHIKEITVILCHLLPVPG